MAGGGRGPGLAIPPKRCRWRTVESLAAPRAREPRQAKVVELRRPGRTYGSKDQVAPWLRLSGRWLGEVGFAVGQRFIIGVEPGREKLAERSEVAEVAGDDRGADLARWRRGGCRGRSSGGQGSPPGRHSGVGAVEQEHQVASPRSPPE